MAKGPTFRDGNAKRHRERMERLTQSIYETEGDNRKMGGSASPNVVRTEQLAPVLREWCRRWLTDRSDQERLEGKVYGPVQWLAQETKLHLRRVSGIIREEYAHVNEEHAELLLLAIDHEYLLSSGQIEVVPNPAWSQERWLNWKREQGCV